MCFAVAAIVMHPPSIPIVCDVAPDAEYYLWRPDTKDVVCVSLGLLPAASPTVTPKLMPPPCYDMELCRGKCGNPLHTSSNIALAKAERRGMLWGDMI
jgi:hypothetical protein